MTMPVTKPSALRIATTMFYLSALMWLTFGILTIDRHVRGIPTVPLQWQPLLAGLMLANAAAMLLSAILLEKQHRFYYPFAIALMITNALATIFDQIGLVDLAILFFDLILIGVLIAGRKSIFQVV